MAKIRDRGYPPGLSHLDWDTDRYRLLSTFQDLDDDWLVWAGAACCMSCSAKRITEEEPDFDKIIYWHEQDEEMMFGPEVLKQVHIDKLDEIYNVQATLVEKDEMADEYITGQEEYPWFQPDDFPEDALLYIAFEPDPTEALEALDKAGFYTFWNGEDNKRPAVSPHAEMIFRAVDARKEADEEDDD